MDSRFITKLALSSYTNDSLDEKKVMRVAIQLSRHDLKRYIRALKAIERKNMLFVRIPNKKRYAQTLEDVFRGRNIIVDEDPELLMGIRITDDDMVYDMSLENKLNTILEDLDENYD